MVASERDSPTPLPFWQVTINILFPFLAFMIEDLGYSGHRLGYYAGGLAAAFCGGQFCSSVMWGVISDRYGRKFAIISGTCGAAMGMLIFGSALSYPQAIIGRFIGGFLNGNVGVMKSFLTEITDHSNRGTGFSYISVAWSIGTMIAPLIGGLLCNPADKFPGVFGGGLFSKFPYLLPCLIAACANLATACMSYVCMQETRNAMKRIPSIAGKEGAMTVAKYQPVAIEEGIMVESMDGPMRAPSPSDEEVGLELTELPPASKKAEPASGDDSDGDSGKWTRQASDASGTEGPLAVAVADTDVEALGAPVSKPRVVDVLRQPVVLMTCSSYGLLAMTYIVLDETIPLFLKLGSTQGGLSFSSAEIGTLISLSGGAMLLFTMLALPSLAAMSKVRLFRLGVLGGVPMAFMWPLLALFNIHVLSHIHAKLAYMTILWPLLVALASFKGMCATLCFTAVMIQVNHSVEEEYLGAVNGLGQSMAALARAIGPAMGGALWSLAIQTQNVFINFIAVATLLIICGIINHNLPPELDRRKGELPAGESSLPAH